MIAPAPRDALEDERTTYLAAITSTFERVVTERVPLLREPRGGNGALRPIALLVETLAGYAIGIVTGELARGVRAWFGDEPAVRVIAAPQRVATFELAPSRFLADAEARPLVDELGARLQARLRLAVGDARATVQHALAHLPDERARTAVAMMERVRSESLLGERLGHELEFGWQVVCAVIERAPLPEASTPRARALWRAWSRLAGAEVERPALSYILAIS